MIFLRGKEEKDRAMKRGSSDAKRPAGPKKLPAEAGHIFKISVERFLAAKEVEEGRAKDVAEKSVASLPK